MRKLIAKCSLLIVNCLILLSITSYQLSIVYAVDSTPSAETKSKLEELKKQIASKAAKLKQEINLKLQNKAYVGTVKTKSENSITLATDTGPKIVSVNQDTIYEKLSSKSKAKFNASTLEEEDYIAALGDVDDTNVLTAKKIILLSTIDKSKQIIRGEIFVISDKLITVRNKEGKNTSIALAETTGFRKGDEEILQSSLRPSDVVLISGYENDNETIEATFVYVIPQGAVIKPKIKTATPSAQTATKSGQVKPTPSSSPKTKSPSPKPNNK